MVEKSNDREFSILIKTVQNTATLCKSVCANYQLLLTSLTKRGHSNRKRSNASSLSSPLLKKKNVWQMFGLILGKQFSLIWSGIKSSQKSVTKLFFPPFSPSRSKVGRGTGEQLNPQFSCCQLPSSHMQPAGGQLVGGNMSAIQSETKNPDIQGTYITRQAPT